MVPQQVKVTRSSLRPAVFWEEGVVGYSTILSKPVFLSHCLAQYFIGSSSSKVSVKQPAQCDYSIVTRKWEKTLSAEEDIYCLLTEFKWYKF